MPSRARKLLLTATLLSGCRCDSVEMRGADAGGASSVSSTSGTTGTSSSTSASGGGGAGGEGGSPCVSSAWVQAETAGLPEWRLFGVFVWTDRGVCIWSGSQVFVDPQSPENLMPDGACYDREGGTWVPMSLTGAPLARARPSAVWSGTEIVVWGGVFSENDHYPGLTSGGRYNLDMDTWSPVSTLGAPGPRYLQSTAWGAQEMIVWGGDMYPPDPNTEGARYNPVADSWQPLSPNGAPAARYGHFAAWTGEAMLIWGGQKDNVNMFADGALYDPTTDTWKPMNAANGPTPRERPAVAYGDRSLFVWGGSTLDGIRHNYLADGYVFSVDADAWSPLPPSPLSSRFATVGAWTGKRFLVWGGYDDGPALLANGALYDPASATWEPTPDCGPTMASKDYRAITTSTGVAIWNGTELWFLDDQ